MRFYHVLSMPQDRPFPKGEPLSDSRAYLFLPLGFSWMAFLFGPLWMIWNGMWRVMFLYLAFSTLPFLVDYFVVPGGDRLGGMMSLLIVFFLGLQANQIRVWHLQRRGAKDEGIVAAPSLLGAEMRFAETRPLRR